MTDCPDCGQPVLDGCKCSMAAKPKWYVNEEGQLRDKSDRFLLIKKWLGMEVHVDFNSNIVLASSPPQNQARMSVDADDLEAKLRVGIEVLGRIKNIDGGLTKNKYWCATQIQNCGETHEGLLIGIREIKPKDARDELIKDLSTFHDDLGGLSDLIKRAKELAK